jgi:hypothetical protein
MKGVALALVDGIAAVITWLFWPAMILAAGLVAHAIMT